MLVNRQKESPLPDDVLKDSYRGLKGKQVKYQERHSVPVAWLQPFHFTRQTGLDQALSSVRVL